MKLLSAIVSIAFLPLVLGVPLRDAVLKSDTSCQVEGGDDIANLTCRNTCIRQGPGWSGGYCDEKQICHCTVGVSSV
ncbi:hypothetical protein BDV25DRAFT_142786 [Aspergillus avenaceus]|uniref:Invertebrate defensins family profile domain-containing protein n=1 Tax=Aspergillus avenaceus TaxID=36643 RepID=A0A5N6TM85_ASPAV|nr:hypothetical protein BDV25DRAFT_142786 [Aspergillus avenaceus]